MVTEFKDKSSDLLTDMAAAATSNPLRRNSLVAWSRKDPFTGGCFLSEMDLCLGKKSISRLMWVQYAVDSMYDEMIIDLEIGLPDFDGGDRVLVQSGRNRDIPTEGISEEERQFLL
ncbi:hypothetical protein F511_29867 [Dorcoceras hygrometricum]|uniref:Uncharacterized protein n=1 Tax=Dorcoceras hygrometricum TaxID=472368 RepID=A0A2Z7DB06_9LAMI|nr:hypothetical protein F511_29867 [Dorcoceras hygrometricum]